MTSDTTITPHNRHPIRPPPPSNYHPHYYPNSSTSSPSASIKGCCCCLFLLFSFLALVAVAVVLVVLLALKPKKPEFSLQQVGVQYINLASTTNPSSQTITSPESASLSLAIRMLFTAKNDNKVGIKYEDSTFNIMYRGIPLGRGSVPGFYQPAHSVRQLQTMVTVDRVSLMQSDAANLISDAITNDRVELRIMGDVRAKIRIIGLTSPGVQVSIDCAIAISPKKQSLIYKQCGFDGLQL
ncbi:Late embryogenesis abundant protein, LEA-14 [Artemisia annua]|uniref:Late embryogenesis abundant protein, LEA-14 n=1 Tax=Artemisia annua TaxID=35608 RepID=A0A2U1KEE2_ARTAN|nr:Late embryogenesis abundant protein, LEA-14 [Artemisia annua]